MAVVVEEGKEQHLELMFLKVAQVVVEMVDAIQ
jgi:hypothetical protein